MCVNIAQERKNSFNCRAYRNGKRTENGNIGRKEGRKGGKAVPFFSGFLPWKVRPGVACFVRPLAVRPVSFLRSVLPLRPSVLPLVSVSVLPMAGSSRSAWFRFRFRPCEAGKERKPTRSHTKPNRPTGACWFRFGKHRTRGEGRGAIPLL